jgi:2-keto-4-pentenoate hydratase
MTGPGADARAEPATLENLADRLWEAEVRRTPIAPLSADRPDLDADKAYRVQDHNVQRRVAAGRRVLGRKVGLTSREVQEHLGIREPTRGVLLDDMFVDQDDEIAHELLIQPRIEAEIAFRMARDLAGPGVTTTAALTAIDGVLPALEVNDSRIADWRLALVDTIADNASSSRVVLGSRVVAVDGLDLRLLGMLFQRNGVPIDSGAGAAVLGHPARCVAWLANALGARGSGLRAGDVVLSGALHRMVPVRPGDSVRAEFAHLGSVSARFSRGGAG